MSRTPTASLRLAFAATLAAIGWMILWETFLAPLKPGGSIAAFKCLPLVLCMPGLARGARRSRQWLTLLFPWYFAEALVRALTSDGRAFAAAAIAAIICVIAFAALLATFRAERHAAATR
jgi:uncharacterized membrane protein